MKKDVIAFIIDDQSSNVKLIKNNIRLLEFLSKARIILVDEISCGKDLLQMTAIGGIEIYIAKI